MSKDLKKESMWRDENGRFYYGWWIVLVTSILCMFSYCGIISVASLFVLSVPQDIGSTIGQFSMHQTILSFASMGALAIATRFFTQKYLKKTVVISMLIGVIGFFGFAAAHSIGQVFGFAIAFGICFGLATMTPCQILISNWFGEKYRAKAMSVWLSLITVGPSGLVLAVNAVILHYGWRWAYVGLGLCLLLCVPLILAVVKFSPEERGIKRIGDFTAEESATAQGLAGQRLTRGIMFKDAAKKPWTWIVLLSIALLTMGSGAILSHGLSTVVMAGYSQTFAASLLSSLLVVMVFLCLVIGVIIDKIGLFASVLIAGICFVLCYIGLAFMSVMPMAGLILYFGGYLIGVMHVNLISPLLLTYVFGEKDIGSYLSWHNIFLSLGVAFGPGCVGLMFDATGSYMLPWLIMCLFTIVAVVIRTIAAARKPVYERLQPESEA